MAVDAVGACARLMRPLVGEHEIEVAQGQRGERLLWFGLDQLTAQLRCGLSEYGQRRRGYLERHGLEGRDSCTTDRGPVDGSEISLGLLGSVEQHLCVTDQDKRRVGQPDASAGALEECDSGFALENGQLL